MKEAHQLVQRFRSDADRITRKTNERTEFSDEDAARAQNGNENQTEEVINDLMQRTKVQHDHQRFKTVSSMRTPVR